MYGTGVTKMRQLYLSIYMVTVLLFLPNSSSAQNNTVIADRQSESQTFKTPQIRALKARPNKGSLYEISFITSFILDSKCEFLIEFPKELDISALKIAGSSSINGGFVVTNDNGSIQIRRSGLGDSIPMGQAVDLKLGIIKNPPDLSNTYSVSFEIKNTSNKTIFKKDKYSIQFISE